MSTFSLVLFFNLTTIALFLFLFISSIYVWIFNYSLRESNINVSLTYSYVSQADSHRTYQRINFESDRAGHNVYLPSLLNVKADGGTLTRLYINDNAWTLNLPTDGSILNTSPSNFPLAVAANVLVKVKFYSYNQSNWAIDSIMVGTTKLF